MAHVVVCRWRLGAFFAALDTPSPRRYLRPRLVPAKPRSGKTRMQLLAPDILKAAQGLSPALSCLGVGVGVSMWLLGWRSHRFWIVLFTTVVAGILGLQAGF